MFAKLFTCNQIGFLSRFSLFKQIAFVKSNNFCRSTVCKAHSSTMAYSTIERGTPNTLDYRMFINGPTGAISPFHDIPLYADKDDNIFNMVVEIPRWTNAKMEITKNQKLNPIMQDTKHGNLRFVHNVFPHHGYIWNYGALPQTYEDPNHIDTFTKQKGDHDPIDVCEIGQKIHKQGAVVQVKVLGVFALIDEGETDWKLLCIDVTDPLASQMNGLHDIKRHMPGFLSATHSWFKNYKIPAGKPANRFAFRGHPKNKKFALKIIEQTNEQWKELIKSTGSPKEGIYLENTSNGGTPNYISASEATRIIESNARHGSPAAIPDDVDKVSFIQKHKEDISFKEDEEDDDDFDEDKITEN